MPEAPLEDKGSGLAPAGDGWFVVNVRDAQWLTSEGGEKKPSGAECSFESGEFWFRELGFRIHVLEPGEPNGLYHSESVQEDFLVLSGECLLLIEEQERHLTAWDFVHFAPGTRHICIGAGDGPCAILMVGARGPGNKLHYPVTELAKKHGVAAPEDTHDPHQAYCEVPRNFQRVKATWPV
jgi:uncharacterized cupin superfamily protein